MAANGGPSAAQLGWWALLTVVHTLEPIYHFLKRARGLKYLGEAWAWGFDEYSKADRRYESCNDFNASVAKGHPCVSLAARNFLRRERDDE